MLTDFLNANNLKVDWEGVESAPNEALVNALAMMSPYGPAGKAGDAGSARPEDPRRDFDRGDRDGPRQEAHQRRYRVAVAGSIRAAHQPLVGTSRVCRLATSDVSLTGRGQGPFKTRALVPSHRHRHHRTHRHPSNMPPAGRPARWRNGDRHGNQRRHDPVPRRLQAIEGAAISRTPPPIHAIVPACHTSRIRVRNRGGLDRGARANTLALAEHAVDQRHHDRDGARALQQGYRASAISVNCPYTTVWWFMPVAGACQYSSVW